MERMFKERSPYALTLNSEPAFDRLRAHPRWQRLAHALNLEGNAQGGARPFRHSAFVVMLGDAGFVDAGGRKDDRDAKMGLKMPSAARRTDACGSARLWRRRSAAGALLMALALSAPAAGQTLRQPQPEPVNAFAADGVPDRRLHRAQRPGRRRNGQWGWGEPLAASSIRRRSTSSTAPSAA